MRVLSNHPHPSIDVFELNVEAVRSGGQAVNQWMNG